MPSSGRIAAMSCIPPVRVEPIPPWLDDMASRWRVYCRKGVLDDERDNDRKKGGFEAR